MLVIKCHIKIDNRVARTTPLIYLIVKHYAMSEKAVD